MDASRIQETLGKLLTLLGFSFNAISVTQDGALTRVDITSNEASRIIGWHGETLGSLQHLLRCMLRTQERLQESPAISLDVDGYRRAQEEKVCRLAEQKADFVRRTGSRIALAPMSASLRRIVHLHVANHPNLQDLTTESVGEGDYRQVVLKKKDTIARDGEELSPILAADAGNGLENLDV